MNRLILILALVPGISFAQLKGFSFGLKIGANFSQLNTSALKTPRLTSPGGSPVMSGGQVVYDFFQDNSQTATGIVGGAFFRIGSKVFIQPELLISSKGGSFDVVKSGLATQQINVRLTTLDVPFLVGYKLGPIRLNAGPMASLTIGTNQSLKDALNQYTTQPISDTFKQAVFGYQAGVGISLLGLQLDARYEGNLSDLSQVGIKTSSTDSRFTTKTTLWQLTAGYGF